MGRRGLEEKAGGSLGTPGAGVEEEDVGEAGEEAAAEVAAAAVVGAELGLEGGPGDEAGAAEVAQAVGEPGVDVEGQGRAAEGAEGAEVDGHGVAEDLVEEVGAEGDGGVPERMLGGVAGRPPEVVAVGEGVASGREVGGVGCGLGFGAAGPADGGGEEAMELVGEAELGAAAAGDGSEAELVHEGGEGGAEVELAAAGTNGLGGEPGEDEARVGAVGEADRRWRVHVEGEVAVDALELMGARAAVGQGGLNEDSRHEADGVGGAGVLGVYGAGGGGEVAGLGWAAWSGGATHCAVRRGVAPPSRLAEAGPLVQLGAHQRSSAQLDAVGEAVGRAPADRPGRPAWLWVCPDSGLQRGVGWYLGWNLEKAKC